MHELIGDITLCILFAWVLGLLAHFSRQPLILAYLIAGFFIGPFGMGWVKSQEAISVIARPDFHTVQDGAKNRCEEDRSRVILNAAGGQLAGGSVPGMLVVSGHPAD